MTTTDTPGRPCGLPGCDEPHYADGICLEHHAQFHATPTTAQAEPRDTPPTTRVPSLSGRLRLSPMFTLVGCDAEGVAVAGYGVYGSGELAEGAAQMLAALGIPVKMMIVPFYEVTP